METAAAIASERAKPRLTGAALSWAALLLLVVIWGSTFAGIRVGVETITPGWLVAGRLTSGALFLGAWILGARLLRPQARAADAIKVTWRAIGWFALTAPLCMYWLLNSVSGIPPLEEHMVRTRGEAYRAYQRRTKAFFPFLQDKVRDER